MSQRHLLPLAELPPAQPRARGGSRPYRRGADAERRLVRELAFDNALVLRSTGSAGPFDLAVVLPNGGRLLQCKLTGTTPTAGQIQRWLDAMPDVPNGWSSELWIRTARGWESIVKEGRAA